MDAVMSTAGKKPVGIIVATVIILATVAYLAVTSIGATKSYYVTISELQGMGTRCTRGTSV